MPSHTPPPSVHIHPSLVLPGLSVLALSSRSAGRSLRRLIGPVTGDVHLNCDTALRFPAVLCYVVCCVVLYCVAV